MHPGFSHEGSKILLHTLLMQTQRAEKEVVDVSG
jgi:hypothetical protein